MKMLMPPEEQHEEISIDLVNEVIRIVRSKSKTSVECCGLLGFALVAQYKGSNYSLDDLLRDISTAWELLDNSELNELKSH